MKIFIDNKEYAPFKTPLGGVVIAVTENETAEVRLEGVPETDEQIFIRPLNLAIAHKREEGTVSFAAPSPSRLSFEVGIAEPPKAENLPEKRFPGCDDPFLSDLPLAIFIIEAEEKPEGVTREFLPGFHNAGEIILKSGDSVYLHEGAVVCGNIFAEDAENIIVSGPGVFDVTGYPLRQMKRRFLALHRCKNVVLKDFTVIGSETWVIVPMASDKVVISGVNVLTWIMSGDGIDLCGCTNVVVEGCYVRVADDCVAVKALHLETPQIYGARDIKNIVVSNCVLWNDQPGNALEIGYETRTEEISDIVFEDCDVIHCMREGWQSGGVFTIHNGDRANIHDIVYKNIRVEDAREKLIDFKVLKAVYTRDETRGQIRNITLEDIAITGGEFAPSIIRGWEDKPPHLVGPVTIKNLTYMGKRATNLLNARIVAELSTDVTVE
ncbi:MAG: glycosyl hydrolase family 28 protein [Defluviitaleaceae bacterium]|nr:glycosyl hydrolase family 28 protein [Defluviitaleaceae bacterium]